MQHMSVQEVQGGVTSLKQAKRAGDATIAAVHQQMDEAVKPSPLKLKVMTVPLITTCLIAGGPSHT